MPQVAEVVRDFLEIEVQALDVSEYPFEQTRRTFEAVMEVLSEESLPENFYELGCLCTKIDPVLESIIRYRIEAVKPESKRETFRAPRAINLIRASIQRRLLNYLGEHQVGVFTADHWTKKKPGWGKTRLEVIGNCRAYVRARLGLSLEIPDMGSDQWTEELELLKQYSWSDLVLEWGMKGAADVYFEGKPEALMKAVFRADATFSKEKNWVESDDADIRQEVALAFFEAVGVEVDWPIIPPKGTQKWRQHVEAFLGFNDYNAWSRKHKFQQAGKKILGADEVINKPQEMVAEVVGTLYDCKELLLANDFSSLESAARRVFLRSAFDAQVYESDKMREGSHDWFRMRLWVLDCVISGRDFVKQRLGFSGQAFSGPGVSPPQLLEAAYQSLKITEEAHFSRTKLSDRRKDPERGRFIKPAFSSNGEPLPYMINGEKALEMSEDLFCITKELGLSKKEINQRRERFLEGFLTHALMQRFFLPGTDKKFLLKRLETFRSEENPRHNIVDMFERHVLGLSALPRMTGESMQELVLDNCHTTLPQGGMNYLSESEVDSIIEFLSTQEGGIDPYLFLRALWKKLKDRGDIKFIFLNRLIGQLRS